MTMFIPLLFSFLIFTNILSDDPTYFIYKNKVYKMSNAQIVEFSSINFNPRSSIIEFAFIEGFFVVRISKNMYKLYDLPKSRLHLLKEEEKKISDDMNVI